MPMERRSVIESYTITDMAHGAPLNHSEGGVAGPYMIEASISSSAHIAEFFGLTDTLRRTPAETTKLSRPAPVFGALRKATRSHRMASSRTADATSSSEPKPLSHPCPCCGGRMFIIETFKRGSSPRHRPATSPIVIGIDTS